MLEKDIQIMRISRDADMETLRKAFIKLSRRYHPEHFPEKFKQIKSAYDRLSLNLSAISPYLKQLASRDTPRGMIDFLLKEALEAVEPQLNPKHGPSPEFDIYSLDPVLNATFYREKVNELLEKINEQGVEYVNPGQKQR